MGCQDTCQNLLFYAESVREGNDEPTDHLSNLEHPVRGSVCIISTCSRRYGKMTYINTSSNPECVTCINNFVTSSIEANEVVALIVIFVCGTLLLSGIIGFMSAAVLVLAIYLLLISGLPRYEPLYCCRDIGKTRSLSRFSLLWQSTEER